MKMSYRSLLSFGLLLAKLGFAQVPALLEQQGWISGVHSNYTGSGQFQFAFVDATGTRTYWSNGTEIGRAHV